MWLWSREANQLRKKQHEKWKPGVTPGFFYIMAFAERDVQFVCAKRSNVGFLRKAGLFTLVTKLIRCNKNQPLQSFLGRPPMLSSSVDNPKHMSFFEEISMNSVKSVAELSTSFSRGASFLSHSLASVFPTV